MTAFYILALIVVFLGTIINLPGSLHINPILLHYYDPHKVLFLTTAFLVMGALARIIIFWKNILWKEAAGLGLYGFVGGIVGGYFVGSIPEKIIILIFFLSGFMYLYKYFKESHSTEKKDENKFKYHGSLFVSGFVTAFLQAFGMSVGPLRQGYLFAKGHDLQIVHGTIAVVFLVSGIGMISARLLHENVPTKEILGLLYLFPFMLVTMYLAKKIIFKFSKRVQNAIVIYSLILSLILALPELFR